MMQNTLAVGAINLDITDEAYELLAAPENTVAKDMRQCPECGTRIVSLHDATSAHAVSCAPLLARASRELDLEVPPRVTAALVAMGGGK